MIDLGPKVFKHSSIPDQVHIRQGHNAPHSWPVSPACPRPTPLHALPCAPAAGRKPECVSLQVSAQAAASTQNGRKRGSCPDVGNWNIKLNEQGKPVSQERVQASESQMGPEHTESRTRAPIHNC